VEVLRRRLQERPAGRRTAETGAGWTIRLVRHRASSPSRSGGGHLGAGEPAGGDVVRSDRGAVHLAAAERSHLRGLTARTVANENRTTAAVATGQIFTVGPLDRLTVTLPHRAQTFERPFPRRQRRSTIGLFPTGWTVRPLQIAPVALVLALSFAGSFGARLFRERDARRHSEHRVAVAAAQIRVRVEQGTSLVETLGRFMVSVAEKGRRRCHCRAATFARTARRGCSSGRRRLSSRTRSCTGSRAT
jgi:hypothetical protein